MQDFGDSEDLSRTELQSALKSLNLPSGGSNAALRERYSLFRHSRIPLPLQKQSTETKAAKAAKPEKRLKRHRSSCPQAIQQRIDRAKTQRMFLVRKGAIQKESLSCEFVVLGSTGNIYNVTIQRLANCTCPDHAKGNLCKHILFVLLKVMAINPNSSLIYQAAWIESELEEMFQQMELRHRQVSGAVLANESVRTNFAKLENGDATDAAAAAAAADGVARKTVCNEDDCPICFDSLAGTDTKNKTTYCRGRCGANFHEDCIRHWLQQQRKQTPTCPMCREPWDDGSKKKDMNKEGFTNLGRLQGQSPDRDTSSYSTWFQSPKRRRYW